MTSTLIENLIAFNLTRQEAAIYVKFLNHGEMSGYEVAKETGISRSNVYSALQSLAEKGALYLIEGESHAHLIGGGKKRNTCIKEQSLQQLSVSAIDIAKLHIALCFAIW
ncbi:MAG: helix-turn-helix domain-containing protein [Treponema sp.]|nr:helix-turn-helix domain-containing protein [Treponema sp.]